MYEDIRNNKIKTGIIVTFFAIIIGLAIYAICYIFDMQEYAVIIAGVIAIISTITTYYNCDKVVLRSVNAREATREEYLKLNNILDALMVSAGLSKKPDLYVIDSMQPNAFATGRDPDHSVICVTQGLLNKLDYYELEGVIAHELSHIRNYDIRLSAVISVMAGFVVILSDIFLRGFIRPSRKNSDSEGGSFKLILAIIGLILLILSPIISSLIQLAVSRRREFLADASAVELTRNPDGLISALVKISQDDSSLDVASKSNAFMYIENPYTEKRQSKVSNLFSTHPTVEDRVNALKNLK